MRRLLALLLAFWFGLHFSSGYIIAPILFNHLPKETAGHLAGMIFTILSYTGLVIWALVGYAGHIYQKYHLFKSKLTKWISLIWILIAINQWIIAPVINALKTHQHNWLLSLTDSTWEQHISDPAIQTINSHTFAMWHGISMSLYLVISLLGFYLVWKLLHFVWQD